MANVAPDVISSFGFGKFPSFCCVFQPGQQVNVFQFPSNLIISMRDTMRVHKTIEIMV